MTISLTCCNAFISNPKTSGTITISRTLLPPPQTTTPMKQYTSFPKSPPPLSHKRSPSELRALPPFLSEAITQISLVASTATLDLPISETNVPDLEVVKDVAESITEPLASLILASIGRDLLVFLATSVFVTTVCNALSITPILGYLIAGAILGPHVLDVFSNTTFDIELGDFGILFLLFSEGLEVSTSRLQNLIKYLPLGVAQISLTAGVLSASIFAGGPQLLQQILPLNSMINVQDPREVIVLALAGTLSTSAFVFPVLKMKEWEEEASGEAATSVLLLQDLAVAPLLVFLPFIAGGAGGWDDIVNLTLKATVGFGSVVVVGSLVLRRVFRVVAEARSTETFVALSLLVSLGMGSIAQWLGLTDTMGAFAAGVLLANSNYRAQVQADILPFKGILLGIFFMEAGSKFDPAFVLREFPTIFAGAAALVLLKAGTLFAATKVPEWLEPYRLPPPDAIRISLLLAGGGEFAFVVLSSSDKLGIINMELENILTAIVLITMAITPLLGDLAGYLAEKKKREIKYEKTLARLNGDDTITLDVDAVQLSTEQLPTPDNQQLCPEAIIVSGYGEAGRSITKTLSENILLLPTSSSKRPSIAAFSKNPSFVYDKQKQDRELQETSLLTTNVSKNTVVIYGDGGSPQVLRSAGVVNPTAIFVTYKDHNVVLSATSRLRASYINAPIFARARTRTEAQNLLSAGATEVVVEGDELSRSAISLLRGDWTCAIKQEESTEQFRRTVAAAAGISRQDVDVVLDIFRCMDFNKDGAVKLEDVKDLIRKSNSGVLSDAEDDYLENWLMSCGIDETMDEVEFCKMYVRAPESLRKVLGDGCVLL
eukprot:CAMPEP_0172488862 /NCGR_PEP_ID=MMETSP1066-20121228/18566_1 /TAXON_ID=671091 /ORGANISM="Coscinodiscus wailesii, Strain CCMP2513" /LENGTH=829 /DNA_ID=CAMNT_0013256341 /DNA_START=424 /DNA_END=2913 /DNA_ORIENTATION=+